MALKNDEACFEFNTFNADLPVLSKHRSCSNIYPGTIHRKQKQMAPQEYKVSALHLSNALIPHERIENSPSCCAKPIWLAKCIVRPVLFYTPLTFLRIIHTRTCMHIIYIYIMCMHVRIYPYIYTHTHTHTHTQYIYHHTYICRPIIYIFIVVNTVFYFKSVFWKISLATCVFKPRYIY